MIFSSYFLILYGALQLYSPFIFNSFVLYNGKKKCLSHLENHKGDEFSNAISWPIRMYITKWLIRTNSYDLTHTTLYVFCEE